MASIVLLGRLFRSDGLASAVHIFVQALTNHSEKRFTIVSLLEQMPESIEQLDQPALA